jgi:PAP2 superfamily
MYLTTDSLLAFKSAFITCMGYYILTVLKLLYKDARPFWLTNDIDGYRCRFDFGAPSYHLYTLTTFWAYNIIMYQMKYAERENLPKVIFLFVFLALFGCFLIVAALHQGTSFLYQEIMGLLYGLMLLVFTLNFDTSIHQLCEKIGFKVESSRKYKFYLFFLCIGLFVPVLIYYMQECDDWISPIIWLDNSTNPEKSCLEVLYRHSQNRIGLDQTFNYAAILLFIVGMGFGTSYSIIYVDSLDWVHTRW